MILKRIGPLSLAKVSAVIYAIIGFIVGCVFALISLIGGAVSQQFGGRGGGFGAIFGVGAVILFPIMYGVFAFIASLISAALYNLLASWVGGVELDFEPKTPGGTAAPGAVSTPHV
jgi:hypothetical protein